MMNGVFPPQPTTYRSYSAAQAKGLNLKKAVGCADFEQRPVNIGFR
jgi:hypothetical protein